MFSDEYHNFKLTQKPISVNTGYQSANTVVLNRDIAYALDKLSMDATADHNHVDRLMPNIYQMTETNKILGEQVKKLAKKTRFG